MTIKKPHTLKTLEKDEANALDHNFRLLYEGKLESRVYRDSSQSGSVIRPYQFQELGRGIFSGTGSATVTKSFALTETFENILFAEAHAISSQIMASVTNVTASSITIDARGVTSTANFSAITTAAIPVFFKVIGNSP